MKTTHINTKPGPDPRGRGITHHLLALFLALFAIAFTPGVKAAETQIITSNLLSVANGAYTGSRPADDAASVIPSPIGFDFVFGGVTYTQCFMSTNGQLFFSGQNADYINGPLVNYSTYVGVHALWDDLYLGVSGNENLTRNLFATHGDAPNRVFIMQWTNQYSFNEPFEVGTFSVMLYETSNKIEIYYRNMLGASALRGFGADATIGLVFPDGTNTQYSINSPVATEGKHLTYTPSPGGTLPYTLTEQVVNEATAAAIPTYFLTHIGAPKVPVNLSASPSTPDQFSATLSWDVTELGAPPSFYRIRYATNANFTGAITTADIPAPGSPYVLPGLVPGQQYFWQVVSYEGSASSNSTVSDFTMVPNNAPVATGGAFFTPPITPYNGFMTATDVDNTPNTSGLIYLVTTLPTGGGAQITDSATGAFTYTPDPGFSGPDSFGFKAFDGTAYSEEAFIDITVGIPPAPEIVVKDTLGAEIAAAATIDFGNGIIGGGVIQEFVIQNDGDGPLTVSDITFDGGNGGDWSVISSMPMVVTPLGGSSSVFVRFSPTAFGPRAAVMHILSDDADEASYDVLVTGNAPDPVALVDDAVAGTTGASRLYPLANDSIGGNVLTLVAVSDPAITIDGRSLVVPAGYSGTFTYVVSDGSVNGQASVVVGSGTPATGKRYTGLLYDSHNALAGWITVSHSIRNIASAQIRLGGAKDGVLMSLDKAAPSTASATNALGTLELALGLDNRMGATFTSGGNVYTANLRQAVSATTVARYHVALASIQGTAIPGGGFAFVKVKKTGSVIFTGKLPDGRPYKAGTSLGDNGSINFYAAESKLVIPPGTVGGELILANLPTTDLTGELEWNKPAQTTGAKGTHLGGVNTVLTVNGSQYNNAITLSGPGTLDISGGGFLATESNTTTFTAGVPTLPSGSITKFVAKVKTGTFRGRVAVPGLGKTVGVAGVYLPKSNTAWGLFSGALIGGRVELAVPVVNN